MVFIPPGEFHLGISKKEGHLQFLSDRTAGLNAQPLQTVYLDGFYLDKYEVTYEDFRKFKPKVTYDVDNPREPIRGISWYEADAYCLWLGKRLPTEFEWEKAARGTDTRLFVWGNEFDSHKANFGKRILPVDGLEEDLSPYGVYGMNGNVAEWTASWYQPYPETSFEDENFGKKFKVIRGGTIQKQEHGSLNQFLTITYRNYVSPSARFWDTGFRCARSG